MQERREVVAVGKIRDIFDGRGITRHLPAPPDDNAKADAILEALDHVESGLIFANLVDFDAKYGHRRDPEGMAENIGRFDARLPELLGTLTEEDLLIITAVALTMGVTMHRRFCLLAVLPLLALLLSTRAPLYLGVIFPLTLSSMLVGGLLLHQSISRRDAASF